MKRPSRQRRNSIFYRTIPEVAAEFNRRHGTNYCRAWFFYELRETERKLAAAAREAGLKNLFEREER